MECIKAICKFSEKNGGKKMNKVIQKKVLFILGIILIMASILLFGVIIGAEVESKKRTRIVHVDFELSETSEKEEWKYPFMKKEFSDYIEQLSDELGIDSDLSVSILMVENPNFDPDAENKNKNGTRDLGLYQLNDRYIWSVFVPGYWDIEVEFNPFNWKHNTFLALHHLQALQDSLKVQDDVIASYNAGLGAVMNHKIPASTYNYVASVKNNYKLLKEVNNGRYTLGQ